MLRKDGKRKIPKVHRISKPELRAIDLAYASRHPAESYQKLADEAGVDRFTMRERIRRVRGRQGGRGRHERPMDARVPYAGYDPSERCL
jgi:hypothetical protein